MLFQVSHQMEPGGVSAGQDVESWPHAVGNKSDGQRCNVLLRGLIKCFVAQCECAVNDKRI